jgi:hypothetical protein
MRALLLLAGVLTVGILALLSVGLMAQHQSAGPICATTSGDGTREAVSQPSPTSPFSCSIPTVTIGPYGCVAGVCVVPKISLPSINPVAWLGYLSCVITGVVETAFGYVFQGVLWVITFIENGITDVLVYILAIPEDVASALASVLRIWGVLEPPIAVLFVGLVIVLAVVVIYLVITLTKLFIDLL